MIKPISSKPTSFEGRSSPFLDGMIGDCLADDFKGIKLDVQNSERKNSGNFCVAKKNGGNHSVPHFIRSMTLQPLSKIKNTALPCLRHLSPGRRLSGGCPPRLSSEGAIHGSDFLNHLHCMGSPSPPMRFSRKMIRECASRALRPAPRPSLEYGCLKPFESPHPRNNCPAPLETPSARMVVDICLET